MEDTAVLRWSNILGLRQGIYVDACAFDPIATSNTLVLHKRGWRGVNIDMNAERIAKFERLRPNDYNVVAALSDRIHQMSMLNYPVGATDRLAACEEESKSSYADQQPVREEVVTTRTLDSVLLDCPFSIPRIDYLNIDAEGHDLSILKGLSIESHRPAIITIEAHEPERESAILDYLAERNYRMEEKLFATMLFVDALASRDRRKLYG